MTKFTLSLLVSSLLALLHAFPTPPPFLVELTLVVGPSAEDVGSVVLEINPRWCPLGAERFRKLIRERYYDKTRFYRVLPKFMAQFGSSGHPAVTAKWAKLRIKDDPVVAENVRGTISFAMSGPNTRTTQLFINVADNRRLDPEGFAPFGSVVSGMDVVDRINNQYRENPKQGKLYNRGNSYLAKEFPFLSYVLSTRFLDAGRTLVECPFLLKGSTTTTTTTTSAASAGTNPLLLQQQQQPGGGGMTSSNPQSQSPPRSPPPPSLTFDIREDWAPLGASRFLQLADSGALANNALFRAQAGFLAQVSVTIFF